MTLKNQKRKGWICLMSDLLTRNEINYIGLVCYTFVLWISGSSVHLIPLRLSVMVILCRDKIELKTKHYRDQAFHTTVLHTKLQTFDKRIIFVLNNWSELKTLEWWISGLMLNPLFFLISILNNACSPLIFNLQINYPIRIKDIPF